MVIENIHRHLEAGENMRDAALKGIQEIGFTVVSISISLVAAFIPLLFMGCIVGRLFREFALTATAAILISVVVCLTLAPTLASLFMKPAKRRENTKPGTFERVTAWYDWGLHWALGHQRATLAVFLLTVAASVASFMMIPKGFFPLQDTGFIVGATQAAADIPYEEMVAKHKQLEEIFSKDPDITGFNHAVGGNTSIGNGRLWLVLASHLGSADSRRGGHSHPDRKNFRS